MNRRMDGRMWGWLDGKKDRQTDRQAADDRERADCTWEKKQQVSRWMARMHRGCYLI